MIATIVIVLSSLMISSCIICFKNVIILRNVIWLYTTRFFFCQWEFEIVYISLFPLCHTTVQQLITRRDLLICIVVSLTWVDTCLRTWPKSFFLSISGKLDRGVDVTPSQITGKSSSIILRFENCKSSKLNCREPALWYRSKSSVFF